jgi:hypothetical protein
MAYRLNARPSRLKDIHESLNFRQIPKDCTDVEEHGYYIGYLCPHGHRIRDKEKHWCYHCIKKIQTNICGIDINYIDATYKDYCFRLWQSVSIGEPGECWPCTGNSKKRISMPSYRMHFKNRVDNVTRQKAIYTMAWGDIGSFRVSHTCGNKDCMNPLHLVSSWNRDTPPRTFHYLELSYDVKKLMLMEKTRQQGIDLEKLVAPKFKQTISDPRVNKITQQYNEE